MVYPTFLRVGHCTRKDAEYRGKICETEQEIPLDTHTIIEKVYGTINIM
jgi:hypothetical protein